MEKYNVLELFGGCGGLGYGFDELGFNIVCCNELESEIGKSYHHNFPNTNLIIGDITQTDIKNKIYENFANQDCHIILGGPPCVAYSMSGQRNSRDPRGELFRDYVTMVKKLQPTIFVMENVKGILTMLHDKDNLTAEEKNIANGYYKLEKQKIDLELQKKKHKNNPEKFPFPDEQIQELNNVKKEIKKQKPKIDSIRIIVAQKIVNTFQDIGYNVEYKLLNSADYGVPQKRERVIFIGTKHNSNLTVFFPITTHSIKENTGLLPYVTVQDSIEDLKDEESCIETSHIITNHSAAFIEKIKNTPIGKSVNPKYTEAFYRCYPQKPSGTVKENHGGVFIHYEKNRVMTPRELARLQSFPDSFKFKGSKSSILKQLGNAVPVGLSRAIANAVKSILLTPV